MSEKLTKEALKAPDTFQSTSDRLFKWLERNAASVGLVVGLIFVGSLGWLGYGYFKAQKESKAAEALYAPEAEIRKAETTVREERAKKMQELAGRSAKVKTELNMDSLRPVDYAKDYAPAVEKLKALIKEHGDTKAALVSSLNLSAFLLQQKQYGEALQVLTLTTFKPGAKDIVGGFWLMHQGLTYIENQKYDEAAKAYQAVVDSKDLAPFHPEALLKLGVAYELKGQADKAKQTYEKIGREFPNSEASTSAQQYLRLLELKPQQG